MGFLANSIDNNVKSREKRASNDMQLNMIFVSSYPLLFNLLYGRQKIKVCLNGSQCGDIEFCLYCN